MAPRPQFCDWCGEPQGTFDYDRYLRGPLSCGQPECDRGLDDADRDRASREAEADDYERYR